MAIIQQTDDGTVVIEPQQSGVIVVTLLGPPSDEWQRKNQEAWLVVPATATPGETITIEATYVTGDTFTFNVGGLDTVVPVTDGVARVDVTLDVNALPGDELDVLAVHPIYGSGKRVVMVI